MTIVSNLNICVNWQKKEENDTNKEELMKLKYKLLDKLHNVSNSEMDLLVWAVQHSDEASGTMYGHTTKTTAMSMTDVSSLFIMAVWPC